MILAYGFGDFRALWQGRQGRAAQFTTAGVCKGSSHPAGPESEVGSRYPLEGQLGPTPIKLLLFTIVVGMGGGCMCRGMCEEVRGQLVVGLSYLYVGFRDGIQTVRLVQQVPYSQSHLTSHLGNTAQNVGLLGTFQIQPIINNAFRKTFTFFFSFLKT